MENNPIVEERATAAFPPATGKRRLLSLDVFRGATIASMILVNNPGSDITYPQLEHSEWHGWTFTDLVFPFFLWIVGVAMTLSFARRVEEGANRGKLLLHALRRSAIIFAIGFLLGPFPYYHWSTIRIPGVLQRIAVCYLIASAIYLWKGKRGSQAAIAVLLSAYWLLMKLVPVPGFVAGDLSKEGNFARYIDSLFLSGHMWSHTKVWDPEGLVSTLPAIATTLFGILTGCLLRSRRTPAEKTAWMCIGGSALIVAGLFLSCWMPINKNLWTSSYSIFMAGMAMNVFACCYWLTDVCDYGRWAQPFAIFGTNAIAIYMLSGLVARMAELSGLHRTLFQALSTAFQPINASLAYAILNVLVCFVAAYFLYRKKWFLRF